MTRDEALIVVREAMARRRWNQTQLALNAHVDETSVSRMLSGQLEPRLDKWLKITTALGLTLSLSGHTRVRENAQETVAERPMQGAPSSEGRPYAPALSPEALTSAIAHAVASSVDRIGEQIAALGDRIERAQGLARREPKRQTPAARVPRARKHGR